ncbi:unnamed protein product [Vitrella brassicaformis CCMP3155]|uniref:Uncharacterized protein n=1 Tax=Vitrella brassicaformis (strain CCMP3155) TaxID=1169540 RepID=A0A0G4EN09_VITBC|nr:unnamed protein product [Vitrella brassicaformis CCMP3155]|eukprot:CEL98375.1 unnamed protein product [Vitrella brassicaformis CCMP3155]
MLSRLKSCKSFRVAGAASPPAARPARKPENQPPPRTIPLPRLDLPTCVSLRGGEKDSNDLGVDAIKRLQCLGVDLCSFRSLLELRDEIERLTLLRNAYKLQHGIPVSGTTTTDDAASRPLCRPQRHCKGSIQTIGAYFGYQLSNMVQRLNYVLNDEQNVALVELGGRRRKPVLPSLATGVGADVDTEQGMADEFMAASDAIEEMLDVADNALCALLGLESGRRMTMRMSGAPVPTRRCEP